MQYIRYSDENPTAQLTVSIAFKAQDPYDRDMYKQCSWSTPWSKPERAPIRSLYVIAKKKQQITIIKTKKKLHDSASKCPI